MVVSHRRQPLSLSLSLSLPPSFSPTPFLLAVDVTISQNRRAIAHKDQPIKEGNVHISAPHIYGSVLEALELRKDAAYSFLNAGSGTCYLTCIAASILGPRSVHHCVEVHPDVVQHAKVAVARWKEGHPPAQRICNIDIMHGNALELDTERGECALGFDRIYIGAAIDKQHLPKFKKLLKPGGILVGPGE
jgi:protein-L-isoaspartate O-methyltransferase